MAPSGLTAQAVADLVGGRLSGSGATMVRRVRSLAAAEADAVAMYGSRKYARDMAASRAGAVLLPESLAGDDGPATRIVVADASRAMFQVTLALHPEVAPATGIAASASIGTGTEIGAAASIGAGTVIGDRVRIGARARIGPQVVIEDGVVVGDDVRLDAHVTLYAGSVLGNRIHCKAGAVIGGPGFGYVTTPGVRVRIPHVGGCIIEDDVDVGSGSCVDRGSLDDTRIGRGTKLDNLVHVAHNVHTGPDCLFMAGVGVAGSTRIGARVILAGQSGCVDHVVLGDDVRVAAKAGVTGDVPSDTSVAGFPARPLRDFLRATAAMYRIGRDDA